MIEETAVRVEISAARFASQSIFDILRLTVQARSSQNYGQQSLNTLNRQERPLASVDVNKKTLPYIRRQLKQYSVDFSVTKDRDTGQMYLWFKGQDVDRIQTALENCIAERGKERPIPELRDLSKTSKAGLPSWEKNGKSCLHKRRRRKRHFFPIC